MPLRNQTAEASQTMQPPGFWKSVTEKVTRSYHMELRVPVPDVKL